MTKRVDPKNCDSMATLRVQIDALDAELMTLLAERATYIDRAIALKKVAHLPARIDGRVEEVVQNVRQLAAEKGFDADMAETLWRALIEWSIDRESRVLGS